MCSYEWMDNDTILALTVPQGRGPPPQKPPAPIGPSIQDNTTGESAQSRTYQDLLKTPHDEDLFDYYTTAELVTVKVSRTELSCSACGHLVLVYTRLGLLRLVRKGCIEAVEQ